MVLQYESESDTQTGAKAGAIIHLIHIHRQVTLANTGWLAVHQNDGGHLNTSSLAQHKLKWECIEINGIY